MTGVESQYLLGLYFLVSSLSFEERKISAEWVKFISGGLLIAASFFRLSLI